MRNYQVLQLIKLWNYCGFCFPVDLVISDGKFYFYTQNLDLDKVKLSECLASIMLDDYEYLWTAAS